LTTSTSANNNRSHPPALIALLIQLASGVCIVGALSILWHTQQWRATPIQIIVFQASMVLVLTRWCNLAWWWCVIGPLFPVAIVVMLMLPIPSWLYLLLFLFFLVFYWSTYRTQVPYYPSTKKVWLEVEKLLPTDRAFSFVDIGSGLGGLTLYLSRRFGAGHFLGVEIAPLPWLVSYVRTKFNLGNPHGHVQFLRANYETLNFDDFEVVFAYLSPAAMSALWQKAKQEMRPGSILISYEFPIIGVDPDLSISLTDALANQPEGRSESPEDAPLENMSTNVRKLYIWYL